MKRHTLIFCFFLTLFFSNKSFAQSIILSNGTIITKLQDETKFDFYKKSIEAAKFEKYRQLSNNVVLEFNNGFSLVILSAEKFHEFNNSIDLTSYSNVTDKEYPLPVFRVDDSGILVSMHKTKVTKLELSQTK